MSRRVSRRAFLAGAGGATVVAATGGTAAVLANRGSGSKPQAPPGTVSPTAAPSPTPTPSPTAILRGGIARITAATSFNIDTFDAQISGSTALNEVVGRTHSRLLNWDMTELLTLKGDLATGWEQPDGQTVLFHLDPAARWQNRPPLNGRALTAADVVAHFRRSVELAAGGKAPLAQHYDEYTAIALVDSPEAGTVRFRLNTPDPNILGTLAGEYALIQAPEAVAEFSANWSRLDSDHVVGTGPWTFDWADDGAKFTAFREGHRQTYLDELHVTEPSRAAAQYFIDGSLDEVLVRDRRDAEAIAAAFPSLLYHGPGEESSPHSTTLDRVTELHRYEREVILTSMHVGSPPWNDPKLVTLISTALNRPELARRLFGDRAVLAPPIPPALAAEPGIGISATRLKFVAGYARIEGDGTPSPELRQMWEAAGGPGLGAITIDFPSVFDPLYSASSIVVDMLNRALGPQFVPAVETYTTISKRVLEGYYGNGRAAFWFGWGAPLASPSASRYVARTYDTGSSTQRTTGGAGISAAGQSDLLTVTDSGYFGVIPWVQQFASVFRHPPTTGPDPNPFWNQQLDYQRRITA
ncbi:MAG: ABC transporter substrate-binding protein [Dehalococcoidia bacterium]